MLSRIFIERPRLAVVMSIIITLAGLIALFNIPVAQYPAITPPVIRVTAVYPGANAKVLADTVAAPIEKEVNGVDKMLYMSSTCSNNGQYSLAVTFEVGTDPDIDQVNLQNRVQLATPKLPDAVVTQGITVRKRSTDILGAVAFISPKGTRDKAFMSNYISKNVKDALVRINGVSDVYIFGEFEYSMRIWMDPDRLTAMGLTADDVIAAIRQQNIQAAVGSIGTAPAENDQQLQYTLRAKGRLNDVEDFKNIIVRSNDQGGLVRIRDIARVELGAKDYGSRSTINGAPALGMAVYRSSDANALDTMRAVKGELKNLAKHMPSDIDYKVIYDTTKYVSAAIHEIEFTLIITFLLVLLVNYIFLQDWRATLVPTVTIPVSLIGTFAVLLALGYNANTISLFALIMAIGLVVDDAIVVVENVYRVMDKRKLSPKPATIRAMGQVTGPIIATTLVLLAVFVPVVRRDHLHCGDYLGRQRTHPEPGPVRGIAQGTEDSAARTFRLVQPGAGSLPQSVRGRRSLSHQTAGCRPADFRRRDRRRLFSFRPQSRQFPAPGRPGRFLYQCAAPGGCVARPDQQSHGAGHVDPATHERC